jgi:hypothetical protein
VGWGWLKVVLWKSLLVSYRTLALCFATFPFKAAGASSKCDSNFDYDAQSPQPQCWGPDSSAVDVSGYKDRADCSGDVDAFTVASAPPVEQSSGWTWSKATPAQQANRFNMCL